MNLYALKEVDINLDNKDSIHQLLFQLEEKGLFSIETINVQKQAGEYVATIPIDSITAEEIVMWKLLKSSSLMELDDWKYNSMGNLSVHGIGGNTYETKR